MNAFSYLDSMFSAEDDRRTGEAVSVWITLRNQQRELALVIGHRRNSQFANASVNAWHLHRSLCRQFKERCDPTRSQHRNATRSLRALVGYCYEENFRSGQRRFVVLFDLTTNDWTISSIDSPYV